MTQDYKNLFQYFESENIIIDKNDFLHQVELHPDYPSLLSISDALTFLNFENIVVRVVIEDLYLLPKNFVTFLKEENKYPKLYYFQKKGAKYYYDNSKHIDIDALKKQWSGVVLMVDQSEDELKNEKNNLNFILFLSFFFCFFIILLNFEKNIKTLLFLIFPIIGSFLSFISFKDLLGLKNEIINKICNITASTNCSSVLESKKWKLFSYVNFSDLSIIFFCSQLVSFFLFILTKNSDLFFQIQKIVIFCSIPILLLSIYYQKFIEKKWCPICLGIIGINLLELVYLISIANPNHQIFHHSTLLFGLVVLFISYLWLKLKRILVKQKELKEFQIIANRFIGNYEYFKNNLLSKKNVEFSIPTINIGNDNNKIVLTIMTNPFCGHCKEVHKMIENILKKHNQSIQLNFILKIDIQNQDKSVRKFCNFLIDIYFKEGDEKFMEAMNFWFENSNIDIWLNKYGLEKSFNQKAEVMLENNYYWCKENNFNFTPVIFINGYEYPSLYERKQLEFFINDIIEDSDFN